MSVSQQSLDSDQPAPDPGQSGEALGDYRRRELELGEVIHDAMNLASERRDERRAQHTRAGGFCLMHTWQLRARALAQRFVRTLRRLSEDMQTYSLKRQSLRGHLPSDEEEMAIVRLASYVAGHRELVRPWRRNDEIG